jgi:lipoprotein Spr
MNLTKIIVFLLVIISSVSFAGSNGKVEFKFNIPLEDTSSKISSMSHISIPTLDPIETKSQKHFKFALMFDLPVENISNIELFNSIESWYGTKYLFGGTTKKGVDCSGFIQKLLAEVYCFKAARVVYDQFKQCKEIKKENLQQGDLVFFHTTMPGLSHVGMYLGEGKFVHASCNKGVTIDNLNNSYYKKAYRTSGRVMF